MRTLTCFAFRLLPMAQPIQAVRAIAGVGILALAASAAAQNQRPAVVESAQGGAASAAASMLAVNGAGGLTDDPIAAGQVVHISVFGAPDFSVTTRVSEAGDIAYPFLGAVHIEGLNSATASQLIGSQLKSRDLVLEPQVLVTVDASSTGITVLGEVRVPGIYPAPGKRYLSDVIATAGGVTVNTGRVIEISNPKQNGQKREVPWDPTMHNTASYDEPVQPGDRILVRSCGIAYIGGHVAKPGAYSLCGSRQITLTELVALAGATTPNTSERHVYIVRMLSDGSRAAQEVNLGKALRARANDPVINEDDIVFVTPSVIKDVAGRAANFALNLSTALFYVYGNR